MQKKVRVIFRVRDPYNIQIKEDVKNIGDSIPYPLKIKVRTEK
jgi:hypothetical protein